MVSFPGPRACEDPLTAQDLPSSKFHSYIPFKSNNFSSVKLQRESINIRPFRPMVISQHTILLILKVGNFEAAEPFHPL